MINLSLSNFRSLSVLAVSTALLLSGCGGTKGADSSAAPAAASTAPATASAAGTSSSPADKIRVVAAENFYGEAAKAVGGDYVDVSSILNSPDADPHEFEPTPEASKSVHDAKVVIYNGIGYDEWMKKLVDASGDAKNKTVIAVGSDIMGKKDGDNEHVWYDPDTMPKFADQLAERLGQLDPSHKDVYRKQADAYKATLLPFTNLAKELKQSSSVPIAVSEPVFDYMAEALNLTITDKKFSMAAEEETDPAPADVAQLQNDIKGKKINMFVNNIQASSPTVQNMTELAKQSGVPVIEVTETLPSGKNYVQWMTDQLNQIKAALKR
jgi:zinc/manganese transport system substrate-binding protein